MFEQAVEEIISMADLNYLQVVVVSEIRSPKTAQEQEKKIKRLLLLCHQNPLQPPTFIAKILTNQYVTHLALTTITAETVRFQLQPPAKYTFSFC